MNKSKYEKIDLSNLTTYKMSILERKVKGDEFATPLNSNPRLEELVDSLPNILAAKQLKEFAKIISDAHKQGKNVILMFGGHVIKTGLSPLIIDWMQKGILSAIATHGAGMIHDVEIALFGRTSEDVAEGLKDGSFGMSRDTAEFINNAISNDSNSELGYGEALGKTLIEAKALHGSESLAYSAYQLDIPLTVHVAIGTDIIHQHPSAIGDAIGRLSMRDFHILTRVVGDLSKGAVVINLGSAVIMPEVFLKTLSIARNVGFPAHEFCTANFDMITHYRPMQNILKRPTMTGGKMFNFIGHHEIMFPLLHAMVNLELGN